MKNKQERQNWKAEKVINKKVGKLYFAIYIVLFKQKNEQTKPGKLKVGRRNKGDLKTFAHASL